MVLRNNNNYKNNNNYYNKKNNNNSKCTRFVNAPGLSPVSARSQPDPRLITHL